MKSLDELFCGVDKKVWRRVRVISHALFLAVQLLFIGFLLGSLVVEHDSANTAYIASSMIPNWLSIIAYVIFFLHKRLHRRPGAKSKMLAFRRNKLIFSAYLINSITEMILVGIRFLPLDWWQTNFAAFPGTDPSAISATLFVMAFFAGDLAVVGLLAAEGECPSRRWTAGIPGPCARNASFPEEEDISRMSICLGYQPTEYVKGAIPPWNPDAPHPATPRTPDATQSTHEERWTSIPLH